MKRPEGPGLREVLSALRDEMEAAGIESPRVEAERLLAHALGIERGRLALEGGRTLPPQVAAELARLAARRTAGEPLQHIEGTVHFRRLVLKADARALIPRPETEQLVDLIARDARDARDAKGRGGVRTVRRPAAGTAPGASPEPGRLRFAGAALDIGTGSGAIALSLVAEGLAERVVAVDASAVALEQARENREMAAVEPARVDLRRSGSDPFDALEADEQFDLLVSNPPYVRSDEIDELPVHVREHEPREALEGGADGLDVVRRIVDGAPAHLESGGRLYLEIGAEQGTAVTEILAASSRWTDVRCRPDLSGRDRFVTALRR